MNRPFSSATPDALTFEQLRAAHLVSVPKSAVHEFFELYGQLSAPFRALLDQVFAQPGVWDAFAHGPSSCQGHHRGPGGNLRHSVEVARISLALASDPACQRLVDRDVVIVVALLHDLGKTREYEAGWHGRKMSPLGRLVGHKFTGFGMLWAPLHSIPGIGERQRLAILHCLSSAPQGASGGARGLACLEAQILSHADQLSASSDLFGASQAARPNAGFGVRHPHQRETPYHVRPCPKPALEAVPRTGRAPATPAAASDATPPAQRRPLQERLRAAAQAGHSCFGPARRA
ncbi:hypothetical protein BH10PSE16_BH10PSE16_39570 [soil metagenome]